MHAVAVEQYFGHATEIEQYFVASWTKHFLDFAAVAVKLHLSEFVVVYRVDYNLAKIGLDLIAKGIALFVLDA